MSVNIHWFRKDLRLSDNPALCAAAKTGAVLPLYILDPDHLEGLGSASRVWLCHSLHQLKGSLNNNLLILAGRPLDILPKLVTETNAAHVTWTRRYDPDGIAQDQTLKSQLETQGTRVLSLNGSLLWEPWEVQKPDQTPYRVFTPFFKRGCTAAPLPRHPLPAPILEFAEFSQHSKADLSKLLPNTDWHQSVTSHWQPGECGAAQSLCTFIERALRGYKKGRDFPAHQATSRLSPHLHFGEISPNQIWHAVAALPASEDTTHFKSELAWREFSYHLLFRNPNLHSRNLNQKFDTFPWREAPEDLRKWTRGQTGFPIIDAGMRELWQTGYMHNRVRMIVASFLTKNLMIHWRHGLAWFHDTLFDADPANNAASWQWVAGSGADAAPYFRIFNPVTQARKFDMDGTYIRTYVPELAHLDAKHIHAPWEASEEVQLSLPGHYPPPMIDLKDSRERALAAYSALP
ncbi:cryptochrome/photolyase family protein [Cognatishimia activa]|uniref:cryptochrome/photolyase family protein n=1 Tax=Cognatishimia activa TaxID=1715691 RepID=UPI00222E285C|nr:deoxyribodipyrimidine photo-lyase [Cognatishimia activa]UZD89994.1 DNA photolyase family protein [Cognatishimia activa]